MENSYKINTKGSNKKSLFQHLEKWLGFDSLVANGIPVKYVPLVFVITFFGLIYIGNTHFGEKKIRKMEILEAEVEELRADYTSLKADYMFASKQSEVAKKVADIKLVATEEPPKKIIKEEGEY